MKKFTILMLSLLVLYVAEASAATVTFNVNMKVRALEGAFSPTQDPVYLLGDFNGWAATDQMTDTNGDSIYTITKTFTNNQALAFKFRFHDASNGNAAVWESIPDRSYNVGTTTSTYNVYFDNDSVVSVPVNVEFRVNMKLKIQGDAFIPTEDFVNLSGSFNGWTSLTDTMKDLDNDSIYTITKSLLSSDPVQFKFRYFDASVGNFVWEDDPNREYVPPTTASQYYDYFNREGVTTNYYSKSTGNLNLLSTWGTNTDGSGTSPSNFSDGYQVFNIRNNTTPTIGSNWVVNGLNSKVVLGDGTNPTNFLIPASFSLSGNLELSANSIVTLENTTLPTFSSIDVSSTVIYAQNGFMTIPSMPSTYGNLTFNPSAGGITFTIGSNITVNGTLSLDNGTVAMNSGVVLYIGSGGAVSETGGNFASGVSGGTVSFLGVGTVWGSVVFNNVLISGGVNFGSSTVGSGGTLTINGGGYINTNPPTYSSNSTLQYSNGGVYSRYLEWSSTTPGTPGYPYNVEISNNSYLDVGARPSDVNTNWIIGGNLTVDNGATVSMNANVMQAPLTVNGDVLNNGILELSTVNNGNLVVGGHWANNGTFISNARNVKLNGVMNQNLGGLAPNIFDYLEINNTSGVTLTSSITVNNMLTFTNGNITTDNHVVTVGSSGNIIGASTGKYVAGNLQKVFSTGTQSFSFEIGDASNYTPINISFANITTGGSITAKTTAGEYPNISTSGIDATKSVNRYWTLTKEGGIVFTTVDVLITFVNPNDIDVGANTNNFFVRRYSSVAWKRPTTGTRTSTTIQALGNSSTGDFIIGEPVMGPWSLQSSGVSSILYSVSIIDDQIAWTCGTAGTVLRTVNGGANWQSATAFPGDAYNIFALNEDTALVCVNPSSGNDGRIYRTIDGGASWNLVYQNTGVGAFMNAIHMFDSMNGVAEGDPVGGQWVLLKTSDAGATWSNLSSLPQNGNEYGLNNSFEWMGTQLGWMGTSESRVYKTTDGGLSWSSIPMTSSNTYNLSFIDQQNGMASGSDNIHFTTNSGQNWDSVNIFPTLINHVAGIEVPIERWWLAQNNGLIQSSTDRGSSWMVSHLGPSYYYQIKIKKVPSANLLVSYAVGGDGMISRYTEQYANWIVASAGAHGTISPSGNVQVVIGRNQTFTFTPDTGYHVDSIFVDGVYDTSKSSYTFTDVTSAHTITVKFGSYALTVNSTYGSILKNPDRANYARGMQVQLSAVPTNGYHFVNWSGDVSDTTNPLMVTMNSNINITANYAINLYGLTTSVSNGVVTKNPDQLLYEHGSVVLLTQTPDRGYDFAGWSGDTSGTDNPISITMDREKAISATYSINSEYLQEYRSATSDVWALAKDTKGKFKSEKKKADRVFFKFNLVADNTRNLVLDFGMVGSGAITKGKTKLDTAATFTNVKKPAFNLMSQIATGETIQVEGIGYMGKLMKAKYIWGVAKAALVSSYKRNELGLPMPNYHNVGEEVFTQGAFPNGLVIGVPQGTKGANSVLHKKYADVQKSLVKIIKKIPVLHSDTLSARCLDSLDGTKKKAMATQQKSLPPDKHNSKLFAEALALELNIAASAREKFPIGFGELTFDDTVANPFNGQPVSKISAMADSMLSCLSLASITGETYADLYSAIRMINQAFSDTLVDTLSFASKTKLTGVKRLIDVYYLHVTPGLEPVSLTSFDEQVSNEPEGFVLYQNYPNPFNPTTNFGFRIMDYGLVTLKVFNLLGQEVATLLNDEGMEEGEYEIPFDASLLPSGVYYYRLNVETVNEEGIAENMTSVKKMILLR